jgi:hypothetical protein
MNKRSRTVLAMIVTSPLWALLLIYIIAVLSEG